MPLRCRRLPLRGPRAAPAADLVRVRVRARVRVRVRVGVGVGVRVRVRVRVKVGLFDLRCGA